MLESYLGERLKEKRHPEITRREFMGSTWKLLNVGAFIALGGHLGSLAVTSISSGHPDAMTCYECKLIFFQRLLKSTQNQFQRKDMINVHC